MPATFQPIEAKTLASNAASVTFSNIPQIYTDLVMVFDGTNTAGNRAIRIQINGDTASNYSYTYMQGDGSSPASARASSQTTLQFGNCTTGRSNSILQFQDYSNTTTNKTVLSRTNAPDTVVQAFVGLWRSTTAITSFTVNLNADSFTSGSTFSLYGVKAG